MKTRKTSGGKNPRKVNAQKRKMVDVVTGPTSGIGVKLIRKLLAMGDEVRVIVLEDPYKSELWKRLPGGVIPYVADITLKKPDDGHHMKEACSGADRIFHFAAITDLQRASTEEYIQVNVIGTENVLKAFVDGNPQNKPVHFFYMSSISVYGSRPGEVLAEDSETKPGSTYGETKLMAELVVKSFAAAHPNISYTIYRVANMYGPYYDGPFNRIFRFIKQGKLRYIGNADNRITLVHVDDAVDAILLSIDNRAAKNDVFNVSDGEVYTQRQLFTKAAEFLKVSPPRKHIHPAIAMLGAPILKLGRAELAYIISDRVISIAKIKKTLDFKPKRSIDTEGQEMVNEFLRHYHDGE